jgi:hypothetical protein
MNAQPVSDKADASPADQSSAVDHTTAGVSTQTDASNPRTTGSSQTATTKGEKKVFYDDREVYGM